MKNISKILLMLCLFILANIYSYAAEPLAAYKADGKWHFIDANGKEMFEPKDYVDVGGFSEGLIRIKVKEADVERWYYIDTKGNVKIKTEKTDIAYDFCEGMACTAKFTDDSHTASKFGYINKEGKQVLENIYDETMPFSEGWGYTAKSGNHAYVDKTGKVVLDLRENVGYDFHEGLALVSTVDYHMGYINKDGETVVKFLYDEGGIFSEGLAKVNIEGRFGYIDRTGKYAIPPSFDEAKEFHEGLAFVGINDAKFITKWGLIDKSGKVIAKLMYDKVKDYTEGVAAVCRNNTWGFIDTANNYVIPSKYYYAESFKNGIAYVSIKDKEMEKAGYINKKGEFVIEIPKAEKIVDLRFNAMVY